MPSIEEAYKDLYPWLTPPGSEKTAHDAACDAARALALAVLEEAAHDSSCSYLVDPAMFVCDGDQCNDKAEDIRARIEALG